MATKVGKGYEIERDFAFRFLAEQYVSSGYYLHFHRNLEIYGVVKGTVLVSVAGKKMSLTDGQIAIIDGLDNHSYEVDEKAEIFYFHIGTRYLSKLYSLYPHKRLPYFLMDVEYNKKLYAQIQPYLNVTQPIPELKRYGVACQLLSDIIEHYGVTEKVGNIGSEYNSVSEIIQYIYDHYSEDITLESLSKIFYISPKALSKKIRRHINVDLRLFINDVRVQKAVQMREDPEHKGKSLSEIAMLCGFSNMGTFYRSYERNFKFKKLDKE